MKNHSGPKAKIPFVKNKFQQRFYDYFDSSRDCESSLDYIKHNLPAKQRDLHDIHIEPFYSRRAPILVNKVRNPKRRDFNSKLSPSTFLNNFTIQPTSPIPTYQSVPTSLRRSPSKSIIVSQVPLPVISPFAARSKSDLSNGSMEEQLAGDKVNELLNDLDVNQLRLSGVSSLDCSPLKRQ
jgi:hypothetical protein